ncbi:hypothetical protein GDO81_001184 [Engystomops pustulosus]|uniref:Uncharacterized protein n=1 Tax=Engystomops pustulosus TaxID=76066 RepID=A0AAV7DB43_ENGPU|nr:hypothetical protein GDO81_001184 [Engystomops pustulosus]
MMQYTPLAQRSIFTSDIQFNKQVVAAEPHIPGSGLINLLYLTLCNSYRAAHPRPPLRWMRCPLTLNIKGAEGFNKTAAADTSGAPPYIWEYS